MHDPVNHPAHYTSHPSGVEAIQITENMNFCLGNAVKYLFRLHSKGKPIEDGNKAIWYINQEITRRTAETWAEYPEDPRYEISSAGKVRRSATGRERKLVPIKNGYLTFMVIGNGKPELHYAHRAVARTFLGEAPKGMHVCHRDGNRANNHITNLRIDTVSGNARDRYVHGTHYIGGNNPAARLSADDVLEIRTRSESEPSLAREFGVSRATIGRVRRGESWRDPRTEQRIALENWLEHETNENIREAVELIWLAGLKTDSAQIDLRKAEWYIKREIDRLDPPLDY